MDNEQSAAKVPRKSSSDSQLNLPKNEAEPVPDAEEVEEIPSWDPENPFEKQLGGYDNIIIDIMARLPINSRLALAATSKRFQDILENNPNRLPLKLTMNFDTEDFPVLTRTYRKVLIHNLQTPETEDRKKKIMDLFNSLNEGVYEMKILFSNVSAQFFYEMLKTMPQLASLHVGSSTSVPKLQFEEEPLTLGELKKVTIHHRNIVSMSAILADVNNLEEFVFKSQDDEEVEMIELFGMRALHNSFAGVTEGVDNESNENNNDAEAQQQQAEANAEEDDADNQQEDILIVLGEHQFLVEIMASEASSYIPIKTVLRRQANLKTLEFSNSFIFEDPFENCAFQLKHTIFFVPWATNKQLTNLCEFLKTQTQLESIVVNILCSETRENRALLREIMEYCMQLKTVKTLKMVFYGVLGMVEVFSDNYTVNPSVKELYLGLAPAPFNQGRLIQAIARNFPRLNKLELNLDRNWALNSTSEIFEPLTALTQLKTLRMEHMRAEHITHIRSLSLKALSLRNVFDSSDREHWQQIYANLPNLELLDIHFCMPLLVNEAVPFIEDITGRLNRIQRVHVCTCGRQLADIEKQEITLLMSSSQSLKRISFCNWKSEKHST